MKQYPEFSVSMCVYGGDNPIHFDTALNSVVEQTVQPNEIVLTIDGPIPDSIEAVIEKYRSKRFGVCCTDLKKIGEMIGYSTIL